MKEIAARILLNHVWKHGKKDSWERVNHSMRNALSLAIGSGLSFHHGDFDYFAREFRWHYWVSDPEWIYKGAIVNGTYDSLEEMNLAFAFKRSVPTPEQFIETMRSRDERAEKGKPEPDKTLTADAGWIDPAGKFYPCLTPMEHIWLVGQFGLSETQAEANGWIKITRDFIGKRFIHAGKKEATQKQLNTIFDWCEKHKFPLPDWAGGDK